jgi:hypothetical protein
MDKSSPQAFERYADASLCIAKPKSKQEIYVATNPER